MDPNANIMETVTSYRDCFFPSFHDRKTGKLLDLDNDNLPKVSDIAVRIIKTAYLIVMTPENIRVMKAYSVVRNRSIPFIEFDGENYVFSHIDRGDGQPLKNGDNPGLKLSDLVFSEYKYSLSYTIKNNELYDTEEQMRTINQIPLV
jgi:hypothetical protein